MLPNLIVIGAPKTGTTSLHHYLDAHPQIQMSKPKELLFFMQGVNWERGVSWYESHFHGDEPVHGETTPAYTNHPKYPGVPERIASVVGDAKLIYLVGDPIERIVSHYRMERAKGGNRKTIEQTALRPGFENPFIWPSLYWTQLSRYLDHFPFSRILILTKEELARDRRGTMRTTFRFLGVDESFDSPTFDQLQHTAAGRERLAFGTNPPPEPLLSEDQKDVLREHLRADIEEFRARTGRGFEEWSV